jgi:hypothetical protein
MFEGKRLHVNSETTFPFPCVIPRRAEADACAVPVK